MEDKNMNKNKIAAKELAKNTISEIDSKLAGLEVELMGKPYPAVKTTESERENFKKKLNNVCDTVSILCANQKIGDYNEAKAIIRNAYNTFYDVNSDSESFQPTNFIFFVRKMGNILFCEPETYNALISLCKIMESYYSYLNLESYIQYFNDIRDTIGEDNILTAKYYENKLTKTFYYATGLTHKKSADYANIIDFLMHKQINNTPLEKGKPGLSSLIKHIRGLAMELYKTDEDKATFFIDFSYCLQTEPLNCHLISVYDALLSRWNLIDKCIYSYEIVFDLIILKDNWNFTYPELMELNSLICNINDNFEI